MKVKFLIGSLIIPLLLVGCAGQQATTPPATVVQQLTTTTAKTTAAQTTALPPTTATAVVPTSTPPATTPVATPSKTLLKPVTTIPFITPEDLYNLHVKLAFDPVSMNTINPDYATVDARSLDDWNQSHVPAANSIPPIAYGTDSEKQSMNSTLEMLPKDALIVFYDDYLDLAPGLAQQFLDLNKSLNLGYDPANVMLMSGGYSAWAKLDYPSMSAAL